MPTATRKTGLSVTWTDDHGVEQHRYAIASTARTPLSFDAGTPLAAAEVGMVRLDTGEAVPDAIESSFVEIDTVHVTVTGLTGALVRGVTYELLITYTLEGGEREPWTFVLDCVA